MTTVTVTISDSEDGQSLHLEGRLDDPNAINEPPTPALVVASYMAANTEEVCRNAIRWFSEQVAQDAEAAAERLTQ